MSSVSASAVLIGMVLYVGIAGSPLVGATLLFLFSLGMGVPLVLGALAMVLPMLLKMEKAIPWMGLGSAILIAGYAIILITGNLMVVGSWVIRLVGVEGGSFWISAAVTKRLEARSHRRAMGRADFGEFGPGYGCSRYAVGGVADGTV